MTGQASTLVRLGTGSAALDAILGGGIPAASVTVVAGEPGSGKTVFTLQALFHHARQGKKCLYFTTLSEPPLKAMRYMQLFSFFYARLIEDRVAIAHAIVRLTTQPRELTSARQVENMKMRGANYVPGRRFFQMSAEGASFWRRGRGPELNGEPPVDLAHRVGTGVAGLGGLLSGG